MSAVFHTDDPRPGPSARPASPSATGAQGDGTAGGSGAGDPVPATAPVVEKDNLAYCHGCRSYQPKGGWVRGKCSRCADRMIKPVLYDSEGNLIKRRKPRKKKATGAATPMASNITNERNEE